MQKDIVQMFREKLLAGKPTEKPKVVPIDSRAKPNMKKYMATLTEMDHEALVELAADVMRDYMTPAEIEETLAETGAKAPEEVTPEDSKAALLEATGLNV